MLLVGELLLVTTKETLDSVSDIVLDKFYNFELHLLIFLFSVCMCMSGCTPWHTCGGHRQLQEPSCLLLPCMYQRLHSGCHMWQWTPLPTALCHQLDKWLLILTVFIFKESQ